MSKQDKFYCKLGQAVVEGIQIMGLAGLFVGLFLYWVVR